MSITVTLNLVQGPSLRGLLTVLVCMMTDSDAFRRVRRPG